MEAAVKAFDHAVIGAGIVGSWTALRLQNLGKHVVLLEQFREPHTRGSSHGQTRLIRTAYKEEFFARMMPIAFDMWRELERESRKQLIVNTKILCLEHSSDKLNYEKCIKHMKEISPENLEVISPDEMKSKYSKTLNYKNLAGAFLDKTGGVMLAHKSLLAVQELFRQKGGTLWDSCPVSQIIPEENKVQIKTERGDVIARSVAICTGPWTPKLLSSQLPPSVPLQPLFVNAFYWKEKIRGAYSAESGFPTLLELSTPRIYAIPSLEYPGLMKVCYHGGVPCNDPDERDKTLVNSMPLNTVKDYIKEHMPLLEPEPAIVEKCMYTNTPDEIFIVDTLPKLRNVVIGTGFSGTGFKTAPVIGRLLSEMAVGIEPFLDITPFRLSRFDSSERQH
ncbi:peroxisomal sarcosine oxidase-like [Stegodyphus dumicola]|uniref:peroxisomal sarcosine oxidase-like n=1 Tax=Stegodyphus dumicola TaxID=202533 RepID=UPI0015A7D89C|nr:peroxisomal sarcosine oxidase-like [Stegodyphus dumicola]